MAPQQAGNGRCAVQGFGTVRVAAAEVPALRKRPGLASAPTLPSGMLNHADEQTVVGVAAVLRALAAWPPPLPDFRGWGVVGSPRFPGRVLLSVALEKFGRLGPLSVSPLIVPFQSLHALSSMVSLALRIHGPAIGVGGGSDGFGQALLTALSLQQTEELPGVWVVMTCWDPEPYSDMATVPESPPFCHAAALAVTRETAGVYSAGPHLRLAAQNGNEAAPSLTQLVRFLDGAAATDRVWRCSVPGGYELELTAPAPPLARSA
jgi:hypothetical protein